MRLSKIIQISKVIFILLCLNGCASNSIISVNSNHLDYIKLNDKISSKPRYLNSHNLKIVYQENYNDQDGNLDYKIYNQKQVVVQSNLTQSKSVSYGTNKFNIPLNNLPTGMYFLEVTNEKGVKKYLTFLKSI